MTRILNSLILAATLALNGVAQTSPDAADLTKLLNDFLAGASRNDAAMHDRFWAEDLIYTGALGTRRGKAEILSSVRSAPAAKPGDPKSVYSAEEVRIQQYGDTAIVAFRLVNTTEKDGKSVVTKYYNSGTFLKRSGKWQVVNWQATRIPDPKDETKQ
jgi:ketosteroid isomerase-like protein